MEFDAVWDRVKMHIPESFAKGKDDWKLKAIFQQQAQNSNCYFFSPAFISFSER